LCSAGDWRYRITLQAERTQSVGANLREQIKLQSQTKDFDVCHRVETDRQYSLAVITSQEGQAAGARATVIDPTGKVTGDLGSRSEHDGNHAHRKEFVTPWAGKSASMSATVQR